MSNSQKQAVITLIEKQGKDCMLIQNWRPISLVNVDAKIISKVIAFFYFLFFFLIALFTLLHYNIIYTTNTTYNTNMNYSAYIIYRTSLRIHLHHSFFLSKVIASRIKNVLPYIIHSNQTGYVKDRYIGETVRSIF